MLFSTNLACRLAFLIFISEFPFIIINILFQFKMKFFNLLEMVQAVVAAVAVVLNQKEIKLKEEWL